MPKGWNRQEAIASFEGVKAILMQVERDCYAEELATSDHSKSVISGAAEDTRCILHNLMGFN